MAPGPQDDYRTYDTHHETDRKTRANSIQPQHTESQYPRQQSRTRASSTIDYPPLHHPQPQSQAATQSIHHTGMTDHTAPQISPELVAAITEQVLQSLVPKLSALNAASAPSPPTETSQAVPPRDVYTPPSPAKYNAPALSSIAPDFKDYQLDGPRNKEPQTVRFSEQAAERSITPPPPPPTTNVDQIRPKMPLRASTGDATTLERIWQHLFDSDGQPTARLGQFLRGLAMHIIEDFEPKHSLVISPLKMLKFYHAVKQADEIYPWHIIFGGRMSSSSISHMYRDLKCQHHFTQAVAMDERPTVPSLTPHGFESWMTYMIRAHPDIEYKRFAEAVLTMPINNADNVKERFPKELSRRLFPKDHDSAILMEVEDAIYADPIVEELSHVTSTPSVSSQAGPPSLPVAASSSQQTTRLPPSPTSKGMPPPPPPNAAENDRKPPSLASSDVAVEDGFLPVSIERERKPYHAQPGGGKKHGDMAKSDGGPRRSNSTGHSFRPDLKEGRDDYVDNAPLKQVRTSNATVPVVLPPPQHRSRRKRSPSTSRQNQFYNRASMDAYSSNYSTHGSQIESGTNTAGEGDKDDRRKYQIRYSTEDSEPRSHASGSARGGYSSSDEHGRGRKNSTVQSAGHYGAGGAPPPRSDAGRYRGDYDDDRR